MSTLHNKSRWADANISGVISWSKPKPVLEVIGADDSPEH